MSSCSSTHSAHHSGLTVILQFVIIIIIIVKDNLFPYKIPEITRGMINVFVVIKIPDYKKSAYAIKKRKKVVAVFSSGEKFWNFRAFGP